MYFHLNVYGQLFDLAINSSISLTKKCATMARNGLKPLQSRLDMIHRDYEMTRKAMSIYKQMYLLAHSMDALEELLENSQDLEEFSTNLSTTCHELCHNSKSIRAVLMELCKHYFVPSHTWSLKDNLLVLNLTEEVRQVLLDQTELKTEDLSFTEEIMNTQTSSLVSCITILSKGIIKLDGYFMIALELNPEKREILKANWIASVKHWSEHLVGLYHSMTNAVETLNHHLSEYSLMNPTPLTSCLDQSTSSSSPNLKRSMNTGLDPNQLQLTPGPSKKSMLDSSLQSLDTSTSYTSVNGTTHAANTWEGLLTSIEGLEQSENSALLQSATLKTFCSISSQGQGGLHTTRIPVDPTSDLFYELNLYRSKEYLMQDPKTRWTKAIMRIKSQCQDQSSVARALSHVIMIEKSRIGSSSEKEIILPKKY